MKILFLSLALLITTGCAQSPPPPPAYPYAKVIDHMIKGRMSAFTGASLDDSLSEFTAQILAMSGALMEMWKSIDVMTVQQEGIFTILMEEGIIVRSPDGNGVMSRARAKQIMDAILSTPQL